MSGVRRFAALCLAIAGWIALPASALAEELVTFDGAAGRGAPLQASDEAEGRGPVSRRRSPALLPRPSSNRQTDRRDLRRLGLRRAVRRRFHNARPERNMFREFGEAVPDAVAGLAYLARLPYVDAKRVAAVGYSQGGDTALKLASGRYDFEAAIAAIPPAPIRRTPALQIPTLIPHRSSTR